VVAAIGIGGLTLGINVFRKHFKSVTFDDVVARDAVGQEHLTQQDESTAFGAVKAFLLAEGLEAKLPWVRLPNRVRPLMEKYYSRVQDKPMTAEEVLGRDKIIAKGHYYVLLEVQVKGVDGSLPMVRHYAVEETEDAGQQRTYRVDWETAVEWREMSIEDFKKSLPRGNIPFRAKLSASNYYNHSFSDEKKWFATEVYYPQPGRGNETLFYGYMDRNSPIFKQLGETIESGQHPPVIINLRYPENAISPEQVVIDSLVLDSWFYVDDVAPGETQAGAK